MGLVGATPVFLIVHVWRQEFTLIPGLPPHLLENKIQPSKFGDLIGFIKLFMSWVAFCLVIRRALLKGYFFDKMFLSNALNMF